VGCWTKNYRPPKTKKTPNRRRKRLEQKERNIRETLELLGEMISKKVTPEPKQYDRCEICSCGEAIFLASICEETIELCGFCQKEYEKVFTDSIPLQKGIRILHITLGAWDWAKRNNAEYWDNAKEKRQLFMMVANDNEANFVLEKYGKNYQLAILNNRGDIVEITKGPNN